MIPISLSRVRRSVSKSSIVTTLRSESLGGRVGSVAGKSSAGRVIPSERRILIWPPNRL